MSDLKGKVAIVTGASSGLGVAFVPRTAPRPETLKHAPINGVELRRTVYLYGVAGRQRTPVASAILKMLRAADWSRYTG